MCGDRALHRRPPSGAYHQLGELGERLMVVGRGEDTVEPDARVDQADEEPVVQHDPPILQNGRRPAGRPQRQQDPQEKDGQAACSDRASLASGKERPRCMHRSQSFSFLALREIATALERARRELSNGTLHPPQFSREE